MIKKRAAAGRIIERPAHGVLHQSLAEVLRRDLPKLLKPDAELLRLPIFMQREFGDQGFGQVAAGAFGEQRVFGTQLHAAGEAGLWVSVFTHSHVAGGDAGNRSVLEQHFGGGKARIYFHAERFSFFCQVSANLAERSDKIAVVAHQRRQHEVRQPHRAGMAEYIEAVRLDRRMFEHLLAAPLGNEAVEPDRIDHRAGENVCADFGAFFDHDDGCFRRQLP